MASVSDVLDRIKSSLAKAPDPGCPDKPVRVVQVPYRVPRMHMSPHDPTVQVMLALPFPTDPEDPRVVKVFWVIKTLFDENMLLRETVETLGRTIEELSSGEMNLEKKLTLEHYKKEAEEGKKEIESLKDRLAVWQRDRAKMQGENELTKRDLKKKYQNEIQNLKLMMKEGLSLQNLDVLKGLGIDIQSNLLDPVSVAALKRWITPSNGELNLPFLPPRRPPVTPAPPTPPPPKVPDNLPPPSFPFNTRTEVLIDALKELKRNSLGGFANLSSKSSLPTTAAQLRDNLRDYFQASGNAGIVGEISEDDAAKLLEYLNAL